MMKLVLSLLVLVTILSSAISQDDAAQMEMFKKLVSALCKPDLPADKAKILADCENILPKTFHDVQDGCAKQALGLDKITLPTFCYRADPNANKLVECLKTREQEAAKHGIIIDPKVKEDFKVKYMGCVAKAM